MVDITASSSAAASVPQNIPMYFGGFFDMPVAGLPIYFWIIALGATAFVLYLVYTVWVYSNLGPVWGWYVSSRKREPMALKQNKNRKARMVPISSVAHIFHDDENPEMWHQTSLESAQMLGDVPMVHVCDWHDWVDDEVINQAIVTSAEAWNKHCKEVGKETVTDENNVVSSNLIFDYVTYQKHLKNGDLKDFLPKGVEVDAFFIVDFSKVERYMANDRSASTFGGFITYYASQMADKGAKAVWALLVPIAAICGMVLITSIIAYMILKMAG
jgi:hypothetical protein